MNKRTERNKAEHCVAEYLKKGTSPWGRVFQCAGWTSVNAEILRWNKQANEKKSMGGREAERKVRCVAQRWKLRRAGSSVGELFFDPGIKTRTRLSFFEADWISRKCLVFLLRCGLLAAGKIQDLLF